MAPTWTSQPVRNVGEGRRAGCRRRGVHGGPAIGAALFAQEACFAAWAFVDDVLTTGPAQTGSSELAGQLLVDWLGALMLCQVRPSRTITFKVRALQPDHRVVG